MDQISYEIKPDGMIMIDTGKISGKNHQSADELLDSLADLLGGEVEVKQKPGHVKTHLHGSTGQHHHH